MSRAFEHSAFDPLAFDVEFWDGIALPSDPNWTAKAKQSEIWTPKDKQDEVWIPDPVTAPY